MQGFHIPAAPPLYTNTFLLISDAGHAVVMLLNLKQVL